MDIDYYVKLLLGLVVIFVLFVVPVLLCLWWVYKHTKKVMGEKQE